MRSQREYSELIQRWKDRRARSELSSTEKRKRFPRRDALVHSHSAKFWTVFLEELEANISALHEIHFSGSVSPFGKAIVRVAISDDSKPFLSSRTDLILDNDRIRCSVLNGGIYYLNFTPISDTQIVVHDIQAGSDPMDPCETAEYVIDRMLNIIEWGS